MREKSKLKVKWNLILLLIGCSSVFVRALMHYSFDKSALLYILVPFLISMALIWIDRPTIEVTWKRRLLNHVILSLIVMLASSVVLFEGFICVVMFMPIYFLVILLVFIFKYIAEKYRNRASGKLFSHLLPLLLIVSSLEGSVPELSFDRNNEVQITRETNANFDQIKSNLISFDHGTDSHNLLLKLFPMPNQIKAKSFEIDEIHKLHFSYDRWFVTNTHKGIMTLRVEESSSNLVRTVVESDTSYISHYLELETIEIRLEPINKTTSLISVSVRFKRKLDPAWYFQPLEQYGIEKFEEFLINNIAI